MEKIKFRFWYNGGLAGIKMVYWPLDKIDLEIYLNSSNAMHYTGITDKKNKEIYEEDIVKIDWRNSQHVPEKLYKVIYLPDYGRFNLVDLHTDGNNDMIDFDPDVNEGLEVVGNTYENPELLK